MDPHRWRLDGQLALGTGGSAGIGLAIARELLGFGARVLITARNGDSLERARDELAEEFPDGDIRALIADVADDEQRRELLDWVEDQDEGLNILANNAGGNLTRARTEYTEDEWREIFERSDEHTSEIQSLMRISYAVCCLQIKTTRQHNT